MKIEPFRDVHEYIKLFTPVGWKSDHHKWSDTVRKMFTEGYCFNFAKALMNSAIVMLIYKPVVLAMRRAKLIPGKVDVRFNKQSVIMLSVVEVTLIAAIVIFVILRSNLS